MRSLEQLLHATAHGLRNAFFSIAVPAVMLSTPFLDAYFNKGIVYAEDVSEKKQEQYDQKKKVFRASFKLTPTTVFVENIPDEMTTVQLAHGRKQQLPNDIHGFFLRFAGGLGVRVYNALEIRYELGVGDSYWPKGVWKEEPRRSRTEAGFRYWGFDSNLDLSFMPFKNIYVNAGIKKHHNTFYSGTGGIEIIPSMKKKKFGAQEETKINNWAYALGTEYRLPMSENGMQWILGLEWSDSFARNPDTKQFSLFLERAKSWW